MGKIRQKRLEMEVKETLKAKERYRWYKAINKLVIKGMTVKDACKDQRIGRSEYYYWNRRVSEVLELTKPGSRITVDLFRSLSRKPKYSPKQIPKHIEDLVVKLRRKTNQGAEYIQHDLITKYHINLSVTGIYKVLKRRKIIKERKYHKKKKLMIIKRNYQPGEKVQIDTKYVKTAKGKTYYQFGAIDLATGIIFKQLFEHIDPASSCEFLRNVANFYPFKIQKVQTDNGIEYTWRLTPEIQKIHPFTQQCGLLQIQHVYIPPASPTFNSHIERTHRVDQEELWRKKRYHGLKSMKKALKKHVKNYNHKRATPSKNWRTPVEFAKDQFGLKISNLKYLVLNV